VETASIAAVHTQLSDGIPFGSHDYLARRLSSVYVAMLTAVAEKSVAAARLLSALDGEELHEIVSRDSLVRRTIEDGVCTVVGGLSAIETDTLDDVLAAAAESVATGRRSLLDQVGRCIPLGSAPAHGYVWADDAPDTAPGRRFVGEVVKRLPGFHVAVPTEEQVQALVAGRRLALQIAPDLARSALSHLFVVVIGEFEDGMPPIDALTVPGLPGVMLLSPRALPHGAAVAETMLHEALHLKFLDIDYVHPLFATGFRPYTSPRVTPAWHQDDPEYGGWPIDRLLTSMHVYLSLAVFFGTAAERPGDDEFYPPDDCAARVEKCRSRASWLFEAAQDHVDHLSPSGQEFLATIGAMLAELDAAVSAR